VYWRAASDQCDTLNKTALHFDVMETVGIASKCSPLDMIPTSQLKSCTDELASAVALHSKSLVR
jgi:hypothetical protein